MNKAFVGYYRVSTDRQGRSGLGLEAQRASVLHLAQERGAEIVAEFTEVESGKKNNRPKLHAALRECRRRKATLVIARLDRLARNACFLLQLRDSTIEFIAADNPGMNKLVVGVLAVVAEDESDRTSARTKAALAEAKRRGTKLGSPCPEKGSRLGIAAIRANVSAHDANVMPIIREIQQAGVTSLLGIAGALNARGVKTRRGGEWFAASVRRLIARSNVR